MTCIRLNVAGSEIFDPYIPSAYSQPLMLWSSAGLAGPPLTANPPGSQPPCQSAGGGDCSSPLPLPPVPDQRGSSQNHRI